MARFYMSQTTQIRLDVIRYLAGFFDADGSVCIVTTNPRKGTNKKAVYEMRLCVSQLTEHVAVLELFKTCFGGSICSQASVKGRRPMSVWNCQSKAAVIALQEMFPYLIVKHRAAFLSLAYQRWKNQVREDRIANRIRLVPPNELKVGAAFHRAVSYFNGKHRTQGVAPSAMEALAEA